MNMTYKSDEVIKRIDHIKAHLSQAFNIEHLVSNIEGNKGNVRACVMGLSSHALASSMYSWFESSDLSAMRQWCYVAAKLDQKWYQMEVDRSGPLSRLFQLLKPLLSNHEETIEWFSHYETAFDLERVEDQKTMDFIAYQAILALRGEWDRLKSRCEAIIGLESVSKAQRTYLIDQHFFLALAKKDINGMKESLLQLVAPKMLRARGNDESGYTDDLISTPAVIYSKIAWRHGHKIEIDSPYIPKEWLPNEPLKRYDNHYGFLAR